MNEELWVPAEELEEFNRYIKALIEVDAAYFGDGFSGLVPDKFGLRGKNAVEQYICLRGTADYNRRNREAMGIGRHSIFASSLKQTKRRTTALRATAKSRRALCRMR
jgi:hypothetical protein